MNVMSKIRPNTRKEEVFNTLGLHPNSTTKELAGLMPHHSIDNISHAISSMAAKNLVFVTGKKREEGPSGRITTHSAYSVKYKKADKDAAPQPIPRPELFNSLIETLETEIAVLAQWKEAALLRYPDLEVDPLVLEARALLAAEAEAQGSIMASQAYITGNRDHTVAVQALVKALGAKK